jgi:hypothetical protein
VETKRASPDTSETRRTCSGRQAYIRGEGWYQREGLYQGRYTGGGDSGDDRASRDTPEKKEGKLEKAGLSNIKGGDTGRRGW